MQKTNKPGYIAALPPGAPLDVIGDIHGEIDALEILLDRLGWGNGTAAHPDRRHLVFVGDLVDRGPDSAAVVQRVRSLVDAGRAHCLLGNHELNLLLPEVKDDHLWIHGKQQYYRQNRELLMPQESCSRATASDIRAWVQTLPVAAERPGLRIVHAAWVQPAIDALRDERETNRSNLFDRWVEGIKKELGSVVVEAAIERRSFPFKDPPEIEPPPVPTALRTMEFAMQNFHPLKSLTSGIEAPRDSTFYVNGKWRYMKRVPWWNHYRDSDSVIMGHYWRSFEPAPLRDGSVQVERDPVVDHQALFKGTSSVGPIGPKRNVWCVDFSVGRRFRQRQMSDQDVENKHFSGRLACLRWPEREMVFDDGETVQPGARV